MGLNLSSIAKRKELRCIIVEDENKKIGTYYDNLDKMLDIINKNDEENHITTNVVKVFNPDTECQSKIVAMIVDNLKITEEKLNIEVGNVEFATTLLNLLTDVNVDLDIKNTEDVNTLINMLKDPSFLLGKVLLEITEIANSIFFDFVRKVDEESKIPNELKSLVKSVEELNANAKELKIQSLINDKKPSTKKKSPKRTTKKVDEATDNVNIEKESDING